MTRVQRNTVLSAVGLTLAVVVWSMWGVVWVVALLLVWMVVAAFINAA